MNIEDRLKHVLIEVRACRDICSGTDDKENISRVGRRLNALLNKNLTENGKPKHKAYFLSLSKEEKYEISILQFLLDNHMINDDGISSGKQKR